MSKRYDRTIDAEHFNPASSHEKILMQIRPGSTVLECGCATGYMTRYMRDELGCEVSIIEYDAESYAVARQYASDGICADLMQSEWLAKFQGRQFDYILFADVLEHLYDPQAVLKSAVSLLKENGMVLASLPNIAHGDVLVNLWNGNWNYTEVGLLDKTHIHFFAKNNLEPFFREAGLDIVHTDYTTIPIGMTEQSGNFSCCDAKLLSILAERPKSEEYQFIVSAQKIEYVELHHIEKEQTTQFHNSQATLYYSLGDGFSEEQSKKVYYTGPDFHHRFVWKSIHPVELRFDPIEWKSCLVTSLQVSSNAGELEISPLNGYRLGHTDVFYTIDPQYSIKINGLFIEWIEINAHISLVSNGQIQSGLADLVQNCLKLEETRRSQELELLNLMSRHEKAKQEMMQQYEKREQELLQQNEETRAELTQEYEEAKQELIQQNEEEKRKLQYQHEEEKQELICLQEELEQSLTDEQNHFSQMRDKSAQELEQVSKELTHYRVHYHAAIAQREDLKQQLALAQNAYNVISNAFFWKITKPFRWTLDGIKSIFRRNRYARLAYKGFKCWRENGISYTWKRVQNKIHDQQNYFAVRNLCLPNDLEHQKASSVKYLGDILKGNIELVYQQTIDVIVPVYNGFSFLERLLTSIEQTKVPYQLVLVEDKSSDPRVTPFLKKYTKTRENVVLIENEVNLGFVGSINKGLAYSKNHVAIVNTDVELPERWLERLMLPIVAAESVASTTPFTNSGTICSFPDFCKNNDLFLEFSVREIDAEFEKISPRYPVIPTGVGFCMGMNRETIERIGLLDEETFGKGYGEENDWCRRAENAGFVNVHVENLFVYHQHGASFPSAEKEALIKRNSEALLKKHPNYNRIVALYCEMDPCASIRESAKRQLVRNDTRYFTILIFNHSWGGGATAYLERECRKPLQEGKRIVLVEYQPNGKFYRIQYNYGNDLLELNELESPFPELCKVLPNRIDEIWINELVSYPNLFHVLETVPTFSKRHGAKLLYLLHDYFALCPTINLLNVEGRFCELPNLQKCELCLKNNTHFENIHCEEKKEGMAGWRRHWSEFFGQCDEIRTFSKASRELLCQTYENISTERITVHPHQIDYLPRIDGKKKRGKTLNIAVIGSIEENKGNHLVKQMAQLIKKENLKIRLTIIGEARPSISHDLCNTTGKYKRSMLPFLVLQNDIDLILIPSIWPETFSYTTEEAMTMGMPVACLELGAPAERVAKYKKGLLLPKFDAKDCLYRIQRYSERVISRKNEKTQAVLFVAERRDYASRYRVEHFREELMFQGVNSDFVLSNDIRRISISQYDAVVLYRSSSARVGNYLRREADSAGIKLFFDIDDLVFDSDAVSNSLMPDEEKKMYLSKVNNYCVNMRYVDGLIASTDTLAERMRNLFPEKPICVRRNSASLEMETLSVCAGQNFQRTDDTVSLAYFSGSWTHDGDFAQIVNPLLQVFQKYSNVRLKIYGCLNIPSQLNEYRDRIEQCEFTSDWRSLPEKGAQSQIHLAPLEDTLFNRCKSENKWMEAALSGRVTVMSKLPELESVIHNGKTGFLCKSEEEWTSVLSLMIESEDLRNEVAKNAQSYVLNTHLTRNSGNKMIKFMLE